MATFPNLRTGAVAQYPLDRTVGFQTESVRFLDGSRQNFRVRKAGLRGWTINLSLLDEQELASVIAFAEAQGSTPFAFSDPVTGDIVAACVLSGQSLDVAIADEMNAQATVSIEEIP